MAGVFARSNDKHANSYLAVKKTEPNWFLSSQFRDTGFMFWSKILCFGLKDLDFSRLESLNNNGLGK